MSSKYVEEFYASLKHAMVNNEKPPVPENRDTLLGIVDQFTGKEKECFIIAACMLSQAYKNKLSVHRLKASKGLSKQTEDPKSVKRIADKQPKVSKIGSVPDNFNGCVSVPVKLALAMFLSSNFADSIKRDFMYTIINDVDNAKTASYILEMFQDPRESVAKVREYINAKDNSVTVDKNDEKYLICALIELSELLKDKACSKLALFLNALKYITFVNKYLHNGLIGSSIIPFEPLISKYVKESIALCSQESERSKIVNQFKINPRETISSITKGLPPVARKISRALSKSCTFKPDQLYECYKGNQGYTRDIVATYHKSGLEIYKVLTYNDCLFDVLGRITETIDSSGLRTTHEEIFDKLSWSDRLDLVRDFRTKISLKPTMGSELNDYNGATSDITVSWSDDEGRYCSKTYLLKKPKDTKIKSETMEH